MLSFRRKRRARPLRLAMIGAAASLLVPALSSGPASASPVDEQRAEVERIADELDRLHTEADKQGELYNGYIIEQRQLADEIAEAEQDIAAKEDEVASVRQNLSAMAADAFVNAGKGSLSPVFQDSRAYRDSIQADQYSRVALSLGANTTDDLDEVLRELGEAQERLESKRERAGELSEQAADAKEQAEASKAEYQRRHREAKAELGRRIEEEEQRRAEAAYRRMVAEREAAEREAAEQAAAEQAAAAREAAEQAAAAEHSSQAQPAPAESGGGESGGSSSRAQSLGNVQSTPTPAPAPSGPSSGAQAAINAAMAQRGVPYRFATAQPGVAFDCSGLTKYAWGVAGVGLPHQSAAQYASIPHVPVSSAQPGDLLFYYSPISHVGIYLGNGQLIHAPNSGTVVKVASVSWGNVTGVGRPG